jgi:outer membrane receptor protein involved in Fe transport
MRYDHWMEQSGFSRTRALIGAPSSTETLYDDRGAGSLSPRISLLLHTGARVQFFASGYGAFRGPTLNELYRSFRVGNTQTLANPELTRERLRGGEIGATWISRGDGSRVRMVAFASHLDDPVANVTLRATPALITRQRQNLGRTRSVGFEADATVRLGTRVSASAGYAFVAATVRGFDADRSLVGNDLPLVSRHQGTLQLRYANPRLLDASALARAGSSQWDDDQNQLGLNGFFSLDAQISRRFSRVEVFVASENLTGNRYQVGRTPLLTLGPPRLLRAGVRFGR